MKNHWATIKQIPTRREYSIFFSGSDVAVKHTLLELVNYSLSDDYEWAHAIVDRLDDVLDLVIAQSMVFYPNRDDKDIRREIAIIKRIR